ncbi:hypothetical protein [Primorskyibacter sp. S187A]|uniref:hypothetical protein n=1 Tax=Primorskyibacter sp. S187A TaxID=3415130 RepID=UPI003C7E7214
MALIGATPALAEGPLSAIDWLDAAPIQTPAPISIAPGASFDEPKATQDASVGDVTVTALDAPSVGGVGLLPARVTGFPTDLWRGLDADRLQRLLADLPTQQALPAAQSLVLTLLLAEAQPPQTGSADDFLAVRIDALTDRGAVGPAQEMLRLIPNLESAVLMQRAMRLALLFGETTELCARVAGEPRLAPDLAQQVYCQAQTGAWSEAVTTLQAGRALGDIKPGRYERLLRFLDPDLAETLPPLPPPALNRLDAFDYRLMAASGEPVATSALPVKFAFSDLSGDAGWKAKLEAAERLVRAGALSETQLFAAYTERKPSASGGVWDRARAVQTLEQALEGNDADTIEKALEAAWPLMRQHGLAVPFARSYADSLTRSTAYDAPSETLIAIGLLSPDYERLARDLGPSETTLRFAQSLALGSPAAPTSARDRAIAAAWDDTAATMPQQVSRDLDSGHVGAVALQALGRLSSGADGNLQHLTQGLRTLRALGLEDVARRAALQAILALETRP